MSNESGASPVDFATNETEQGLIDFLQGRFKTSVLVDQDLFATGLVSSIFAMELVVHLEKTYSIAILGGDLKLDNIRSVQSMAALIERLRRADFTASA